MTTEETPVIQLRNVVKRYDNRPVLDGVDLDVPRGAVLGLLGTNGAGKTTLIKCALGLVRPHEGECRVFGQDSWWLDADGKSRLGYVPQTVQLYPWMRVRHLLRYTASFYPRWDQPLVDRLVADWDLPPDQRVGTLSVGQQQKLSIVLAVGPSPELLVLDEPVASLDPLARRQFIQLVVDTASPGQGRTVLFSTHITSDLERVADRVAILRNGRIAYHGLLDDLKDSVKRLHVAAPDALPPRLDVPGTLHEHVAGREAVLSVHGDPAHAIANIERRWRGASVDVQDLNLEDIFLEMHHV